jgi:hypothetical protein
LCAFPAISLALPNAMEQPFAQIIKKILGFE